jgi:hypothetical protein
MNGRVHVLSAHQCSADLSGFTTLLAREKDLSMRHNELVAAFADVCCVFPKVVFSRTLSGVRGNARLAEASVARGRRVGSQRVRQLGRGGPPTRAQFPRRTGDPRAPDAHEGKASPKGPAPSGRCPWG